MLTLPSVDDLLVAVKAFFGENKDAPDAKRSAHARPSREPAEAKRGLAESWELEAPVAQDLRGRIRTVLEGPGKITQTQNYNFLINWDSITICCCVSFFV